MEPNKLEQDFKQKLEQRTIQPTEMAWDRLDAMLSVTEEKKKKPNRTWMYMAASFLALLLVGALFLNQEKQNTKDGIDINNNSVTETSPAKITQDSHKATVITNGAVKQQDVVATTTLVTNSKTKPFVKTVPAVKRDNANNSAAPIVNQEAIAVTITHEDAVKQKEPAKISVNAANLLASVDNASANEAVVANANLKAKKQQVKVDANSLLSSVEGELDDSFRGKVLQSVAKNYNIIKTSVASRNRQ